MKTATLRTAALASLLVLLSAGCRGPAPDAAPPSPRVGEAMAATALRPLDPEIWERPALSYSGFRRGQSPETGVHPDREEILEDLRLLEEAGFGLIRVFSSGEHGRAVVELIHEHNLKIKVQLGAYVEGADAENHTGNMRELAAAIELANAHPDIIAAVSVGNEVLVSWSFVAVPPEDMVAYIQYVRERVRQPLTVNDNWEPYAAEPGSDIAEVWRHIDFAAVHTYAYWDSGFELWDFRQLSVPEPRRARAMMDAAYTYARENFHAVRSALNAAGHAIPIVIGETGWQSVPSAYLDEAFVKDFARHQAHPVNQAWYFNDMTAWAYGVNGENPGDGFSRPAAVFYFAAFDEPWKERDDNWGLWDVDREPKYVLSGKGYSADDAFYYRGPEVTEDAALQGIGNGE
ncbi:MAG: hypothetical protein JJU00_00655 [Opitutales bacterium]|nr:hypothetical protein [Opitutales bacterium]